MLLLQYGLAKLFKFPAVPMFEKVPPLSLFWCAGMIELVLGGLLMLGLFTGIVAFMLCGEMAFAYFIEHFPRGFIPLLNSGELAIMLLLRLSLSRLRRRRPYSSMGCGEGVTHFRHGEERQLIEARSRLYAGMTSFARTDGEARLSPAPSIPAAPRPRISNCAAPARS